MSSLVVLPLALLAASSLVEAVPLSGPSVVPSYNGWTSVGCFVDSISDRQLPHSEITPGGASAMTVEVCLDACHADGYTVAGLQWSQECWCGDAIPPEPATDGRCDMACTGNSAEICGGGLGLSVYQHPPSAGPTPVETYKDWTLQGCYVDSVSARVLPDTQYPAGLMTVEKCLDACDAAGYEYAGVEYGQECYCGRSAPTTLATDGRCDMPCAGDSSEACGGGNGIDVYKTCKTGNAPSSPPWYNGWDFSGCYEDSVSNRVLPICVDQSEDATMTVEKCLTACGQLGYFYAGVEYAQECYCGNAAPPTLATDGRCDMVCNGNPLELCGGGNGIDVYHYSGSSNPGSGNQAPGCPVTSTFTTETLVPITTTFTTTIVQATPGVTTIAVPITTVTTIAVPYTASTTVAVPITTSTTIPVTLTGSTTVPVPVTGTTTVPVTLTGTTTATVPFISTIGTVSANTVTVTPVLTVGRTSFTLSIFTGTTSFVDPLTTVIQPVIILTTLAKTYTTTTGGAPTPVATSTTVSVPFTTGVPSLEPFVTTSLGVTPVTGTSYEIEPVPTTSLDIEPVTTTSFDIEPVPTTSLDIEPVTTTSFDEEPYTGTFVTTFTTTITTNVPTPVTVTTVITAPASSET